MNALNVAEYTQTLGLQARQASALMARADAATRSKALRALAALLRANVAPLQADNAKDLERATRRRPGRADGGPPQAHAQDHRDRGPGLRAAGRDARHHRRDHRHEAAAQRHPRGPDARADRRVRHDLREPAQRDHRGRQPVDQERQRLHPARRLRGHRLQQGAGPAGAAGAGRGRPAGRGGAAGADHRPRSRGPADRHAAVRGRDHPARRQGPDRAHQPRGQGAGDQAPGRQLPRLCGRSVRHRDGGEGDRQRQDAEVQPLQRDRGPAGGARRGGGIPAEDRRDLRRQGRGDALRRRGAGLLAGGAGREP